MSRKTPTAENRFNRYPIRRVVFSSIMTIGALGVANEATVSAGCNSWNEAGDVCLEPTPDPTVPGGGGNTGGNPKPANTDPDKDGIPNKLDNCDNVPNPKQENLDGDQDGDVCDSDIDGDALADAFDPNSRNPDVDADGKKDGAPSELLDTDGDGKQNLIESGILDADGDGANDEVDPSNADACDPSDVAPTCDGDNDGLKGPADGNPDMQFEDVDGDGLDDTAPADKGGDTNLTDGPLADEDGDGVDNGKDKQNQKLAPGETVDANGVIIVVDTTVKDTTPDETTGETDPATTVVASGNESKSGGSDSGAGKWLLIGSVVGGLGLLGAGGKVYARSRREHALGAHIS